ncbi:nitrate ABC transporter permease [Frankia sp. CN7]|nr:nitrate ABC transporter permease [Frankia nepalensis]MBL7513041.1 nitrate ABC transporter permease [Frankia nepalensis]
MPPQPAPESPVAPESEAAVESAAAPEPGAAAAPSPDAARPTWLAPVQRTAAAVGWGLLGGLLFVGLWAVVAYRSGDLPSPSSAFSTLIDLLADPFRDGGETDKGIGLQLAISLGRVFSGFALAALVGVPLGLLIGGSRRAWQAVNPVVQILRPVSPLAWFPLGLVVFKDAPNAAVFVIFVTALWPTVLNTAAGAASVPEDQHNVARVFRFSRFSYVRNIVIPHALPSVVTGLRLSMGIAWMVIVAVEMLSGGTGIGFFVWDSYNASNLSAVISAILLIGCIGVVLDCLFLWLSRLVGAKESGQ